jgi:RNA polymerase sigma-70 factor (ECF subfamily)
LTDAESIALVNKARKGDRNAFETLCNLKSRSMVFIAHSILGDYHEAEDAAQETILAMFKNIRSLRDPEAFEAWMIRILRNNCAKCLKNRSRFREAADIDDERTDIEDNDGEFSPEKYAEDKELGRSLYDAIQTLPQKRRNAIIMYYYDHLSYKEIASITGTSAKTVSTNILRARNTIRAILK